MKSSQNENVMVIGGENEIGLNEWNMENGNFEWQFPNKTKYNTRNNKTKWMKWNGKEPSNIACSKENIERA